MMEVNAEREIDRVVEHAEGLHVIRQRDVAKSRRRSAPRPSRRNKRALQEQLHDIDEARSSGRTSASALPSPGTGTAGTCQQDESRPDHGETSYRGSGRLTGRKALITGGGAGMGHAAAIAFAREGADVAINCLPFEEPGAKEVVALIRSEGGKAVAPPGDLREEAFLQHTRRGRGP